MDKPAAEKPQFPLPPYQPAVLKRRRKKRSLRKKSLHAVKQAGDAAAKGMQTIVDAPGKLIEHVNQELYKRNAELTVRNKTLALLRQLDEISLATAEIDEMAQKISTAIAMALGYDLVSIAIVDEREGTLQWLAISSSVPWIKDVVPKIKYNVLKVSLLSDTLASLKALRVTEPQFADDLGEVYPITFVESLTRANVMQDVEPVKHSIIYPLRFGEKVLGILTISSSRPLQDASRYEQETVSGVIGLVSLALYKADIYEDLQQTTADLAAANKQLTELDKAKSEFLSIASHQLYTPLTALRGYISMMQEGDFGEVPAKQAPILDILNTSVGRLVTLIKNLLDVSRIESGRLELNLQSIDLVKMADDLIQSLYPNAVAKGLKLVFHHPPATTPHVVADEQRLRQVMLNFIDNAIKYTQKGRIDIAIEVADDNVVFSVTDTGKGLGPEEVAKLFHKFSRVGGASRFNTEGTGLGLYVAKQIVHEHHGEVSATSPGTEKGSTFSMHLPKEGSPRSLKVGAKATVVIKAAEANEPPAAQ